MPPITIYQDYFSRANSNPYEDMYFQALITYCVGVMKHAASLTPRDLRYQIFTTKNVRDPTPFFLWINKPNVNASANPRHVALVHTVSVHLPHRAQSLLVGR